MLSLFTQRRERESGRGGQRESGNPEEGGDGAGCFVCVKGDVSTSYAVPFYAGGFYAGGVQGALRSAREIVGYCGSPFAQQNTMVHSRTSYVRGNVRFSANSERHAEVLPLYLSD